MSRLIRESDIQDMLDDAQCISDGEYSYVCTEDIKLSKLPTVDAVPVVRCRECKRWGCPIPSEMKEEGYGYCGVLWTNTHENEYCAWGERKRRWNNG